MKYIKECYKLTYHIHEFAKSWTEGHDQRTQMKMLYGLNLFMHPPVLPGLVQCSCSILDRNPQLLTWAKKDQREYCLIPWLAVCVILVGEHK